MIPPEKIDDVRERTNIVEVVRRHVELRRAGPASWKGLCPFHAEKTPSFNVHESRQRFHCFGCGEGGDVVAFLMKIEQRSFMEVMRDLARDAGVDLPERSMSPAERQALARAESERERMLRAVDIATRFFEAQLATPAGLAAREYLERRRISAATAARFRVGYAPGAWDALQRHLSAQGIPAAVAERLGLVGVNERGSYDFFRDRITLPVLDRQKRPVGFSARVLEADAQKAKYINSIDSELFHKKALLYGLHAAADAIRRGGTAVVVEGNFDVLSLHEAGIEEAVAPMGTALTADQVEQLGRIADRVIVVFDGDKAGQAAALKAVSLFVEAGVDGRIARLPSKVDPDDFVRQEGAEAFRKLLETARPVVDHLIDDLARRAEATIPGRMKALEEAAPVLARVQNQTVRELYVGRLASTLGMVPNQVWRAVRGVAAGGSAVRDTAGPGRGEAPPVASAGAPGPRRTPPADELEALVLLVAHPALARIPEARRVQELLVDVGVRPLFRTALERLESGARLDIDAWLDAGPTDVRDAVAGAVMDGRWDGVAPEAPARALRSLVGRLADSRRKAEKALLDVELEKARQNGDEQTVKAILERQMELIRQAKSGFSEAHQRP